MPLKEEDDFDAYALSNAKPRDENVLNHVRDALRARRDLDQAIGDLDERRSELTSKREDYDYNILPEMFAAAGISRLDLQPEGNQPRSEAILQPAYSANIDPKSGPNSPWPIVKTEAAFNWLVDNGHADMIKTVITITLGRGEKEMADKVRNGLIKAHVPFDEKLAVNHQTLTKFLKTEIENHPDQLPASVLPLETLGATVRRVVKLKNKM